ncbi:MAG TPA: NADH-quinone oxidoreductase subunit M [Acidobacteriota bacterium]
MGLLSLIAYLPLLGALIITFLIQRERVGAIRWAANIVALVDFLISLLLLPGFDKSAAGFQFQERFDWIPALGVEYSFGIDGISLLLILLTTLLGFISILSSWTAITERVKEYYVFMLLLQTGMLGVFMALDFFLFYVFWEVMLVPMYFLIGVWGGPRKLYAAIKFFLYTLAGSVLMLLGILAVYFYHHAATGVYTFDLTRLLQIDYPANMQFWCFLAFFISFAIKVPMFPFHTWLPDAHVEAPTAGSVILAGVLLKMGTYGFVRFSLPLFPQATVDLLWLMVLLSIIGILYGAMVAMMQKDWKKLVAYSSVSHLGFCMLGIFTLNTIGLQGGLLQMINHGLSTGALFLIVGLIYERCHTRMIAEYSGLSHVMVVYATLFLIITLSSIGLPALNGFIGEFTILVGAFNRSWVWAVLAALGIVLGAAYMLWMYQRVFFGPLANPENKGLADLDRRELAYLLPIVLLCFWIGLYPRPFFRVMEQPVNYVVTKVEARWGATLASAPPAAAAVRSGE